MLRPVLPEASCDSHVHVIGAQAQYPMIADRQYTPGLASLDDLRNQLKATGMQRTVIVQPSFYGTDNACTLDALDQLQGAGRGVAVVADDIADSALRDMHARGVRGIRLNIESSYQGHVPDLAGAIAPWAKRLAPLNWHVQVFASLDLIAAAAPGLTDLPLEVVFDHFAMVPQDCRDDDARLAALLTLMSRGQAWVKLSAPYRLPRPSTQATSTESQEAMTPERIAACFLRHAPDQLVWGSDWPHTQRQPGRTALQESPYREVTAPTLLGQLQSWLPDAALRRKVLVDNAARLYGF